MELGISPLLMGFGVGLLVGLTGMGGAALMSPFLIFFLGIRPVVAVGTDLVYGVLTKTVGAWVHYRQGTVDLGIVRDLLYGSLPGSLLGATLLARLYKNGSVVDEYIRHILGVILILVAFVLMTYSLGGQRIWGVHQWLCMLRNLYQSPWQRVITVTWGFLVGSIVTLTSVGSGSLIVPFLLAFYPLTPAQAVGTDVFHAVFLLGISALAHWTLQTVNWNLVYLLLIGSLPGVVLGSSLAYRMPSRLLRVGLAFLILLSGIRLV